MTRFSLLSHARKIYENQTLAKQNTKHFLYLLGHICIFDHLFGQGESLNCLFFWRNTLTKIAPYQHPCGQLFAVVGDFSYTTIPFQSKIKQREKKRNKLHPQSLVYYHTERNLAPAFLYFLPIIIFNCESETTLWAMHVRNPEIWPENTQKQKKPQNYCF